MKEGYFSVKGGIQPPFSKCQSKVHVEYNERDAYSAYYECFPDLTFWGGMTTRGVRSCIEGSFKKGGRRMKFVRTFPQEPELENISHHFGLDAKGDDKYKYEGHWGISGNGSPYEVTAAISPISKKAFQRAMKRLGCRRDA